MTIDSISDMATVIRNAITIKNSLVTLPYTKNNEIIAKILAKEGFIHCVTTTNKTNQGSPNHFQRISYENQINEPKENEKINSINNTSLTIEKPINKTNNTDLKISQSENSVTTGANINTNQDGFSQNQDSSVNKFQDSLPSKLKLTGVNQKVIILALKYIGREKKPMIHAIKRISKPSLRWYSQSPIPQSLGGLGIFIVSTSFGIVTDKEA